ncbi:MAG TPA: hypothetical protein VGO14_01590 [Solirubrobacteraceae bacterium]|jgi:hypothetical protein|nr:hypothetical protein [Solirubrobacteraceae bacterium]
MEIRSYRRVFDLERRIYRIDRLRLNPGGVPLRGIVYFLAAIAAALAAGRLPLAADAMKALPWYLSDIILPASGAALLCVIRIEGRPFHLAARAILRYCAGERWLSGFTASTRPGCRLRLREILWLPDGSDGRMRPLRYTGPGAVLIGVEHERAARASRSPVRRWPRPAADVVLRELDGGRPLGEGQVIALAPGSRLLVQGSSPFPEGRH